MITLKHNTLKADEIATIEKLMLQISSESLGFTLLNKPKEEVYGYMCGIFHRVDAFQLLDITVSEFLDFLIDVDKAYLDNPYHSFYHGADTALVVYHMTEQCRFSKLDIVLLMLSALCHDAGHTGRNNDYEIKCETGLAIKYKNLSVLESHSASITLELLDKHGLLDNDECKASIVKMILATDMSCHSALMDNMDRLYHHSTTLTPLFQPSKDPYAYFQLKKEEEQERQMMCNILLHAADIINPCRPWPVFNQLSSLLHMELGQDASTADIGFIDHIVHPYFKSLSRLFPHLTPLINTCTENRLFIKHNSFDNPLNSYPRLA